MLRACQRKGKGAAPCPSRPIATPVALGVAIGPDSTGRPPSIGGVGAGGKMAIQPGLAPNRYSMSVSFVSSSTGCG